MSTLRALVYHRMSDGEEITLHFTRSSYEADILSGGHKYSVLEGATFGDNYGIFNEGENLGLIQVHDFDSHDKEANKGFIDLISGKLVGEHAGWVRVDRITDFCRNLMRKEGKADVVCFVCPSERKVLLLVEGLTFKLLHYLQCGIVAYMPWYFNQEDGVTELEMELIKSLQMTTPEKYLGCLQEIAKEHDFHAEYIKSMLSGYEIAYQKAEIDNARARLNEVSYDMSELDARYSELLKKKRDIEIRILGLQDSIENDSGESEVMHFFLNNDSLYLEEVNGTRIEFVVKDYIEFFDPEMAETMISKDGSYVYRAGGFNHDDVQKLMTAIFVDMRLRIKTCAAYMLDVGSMMYRGTQNYCFDSRFDDAMPNFHIQRYSCLGNYNKPIKEFLSRNDIAGAISQCIASCKSLAFGDYTVMEDFMKCICTGRGGNNRCIELPDGNVVTPRQAIAWLNQQESSNETESEESNE